MDMRKSVNHPFSSKESKIKLPTFKSSLAPEKISYTFDEDEVPKAKKGLANLVKNTIESSKSLIQPTKIDP